MNNIVYFEGVKATVRQSNFKLLTIAILAIVSFVFSACTSGPSAPTGTTVNPDDAAATVNGKAIKMEEVERVIKQQGQGQEANLSPLELAQARLQILDGLIQQEVMYQKAEKEGAVPKDEEVTLEFNKTKQGSGLSQEKFDEEMKKAGQTEASMREAIKKQLAIKNLVDRITGKIEQPKDSEIEAFYNGNKEAFVKKRGVSLAAIVVDPANNGEGDTTTDPASATLKIKEIATQLQNGADFATVAREKSEDNSRVQGGDLGHIPEEALRQNFGEQVAAGFMNPQFAIGKMAGPLSIQGRYYMFKLQDRSEKDEARTLEGPGVRQQILETLSNARKQLLAASYQAIAMNEAKIENYLAKRVVENPNQLSGARPAGAANTNANATANTNANATANTPANVNTNANSGVNPNSNNVNTAKPAATPSAAANANPRR
jgi:peptidyl-prolyl cis-trans isomerase SurA